MKLYMKINWGIRKAVLAQSDPEYCEYLVVGNQNDYLNNRIEGRNMPVLLL